jgi:glycosyltransferase involved in cell wall biosynthesis
MITSGIGNAVFPLGQGERYRIVEREGIKVVPIAAGYNDPTQGTGLKGWQRMLCFYRFAGLAKHVGRLLERPDVIFATHTPLPIGRAGISLSRYFNIPFVFEVRDLWPEGLVDLGILRNPVTIWWLGSLARKIYRHADHIVALAPGMKDGIVRTGVPAHKVTVIPNASDLDLFRPDREGSVWRDRLGLQDRFAAIYFGAMGQANNLEYVLEAARVLAKQKEDHIVLILLGQGGRRAHLEALARDWGLSNVLFHGPVPREEVADAVAASQACLTILRPSKHNAWSPNKMFDALAAGRPVLINVPGWLGQIIETHQCGFYVDPHSPESLAEALKTLSRDQALCQHMGHNARALAQDRFDRQKLAAHLERVLTKVVGGSKI